MKRLLPFFYVIVVLFIIVSCSANKPKNNSLSVNNIEDSIPTVDTTYYQSHKIYELVSMKGLNRDGKYISYLENGDTLLLGQYQNGLRSDTWFQKNYDDKIKDSNNPLSDLGYSGIGTNKLYFMAYFARIYYEFSRDSIKTIHEYSSRKKKPDQLINNTLITYGHDTLVVQKVWYPNGVHSGINKSINGGIPTDTSWEWREDGTLYRMDLYDHGKLIWNREYDKTGTKVIKEKKGE